MWKLGKYPNYSKKIPSPYKTHNYKKDDFKYINKLRKMSNSNKSEFVSKNTSAQIKSIQTFSIILPNLIHQSKKRNPKN